MGAEFCPRCGAPQTASFRYCRRCQFDFEAPVDPPQSPGRSTEQQPAVTAATRSSAPILALVGLLAIASVVAIAVVAGLFGRGNGSPDPAALSSSGSPRSYPVITGPPSRPPTPTPRPSPTPDLALAAACEAIAEFRSIGDYLEDVSSSLDGPYDEWSDSALLLIDQVERFVVVSREIPNESPYRTWLREALLISKAITEATLEWDDGMQDDDISAILRGNQILEDGSDHIESMNAAARAWEDACY
jgi:hypothetical protein